MAPRSSAQMKAGRVARPSLANSKTILIKIGTEIVHSTNGIIAMGQIGALIEQIASLHLQGYRVILISSGAVAIGRMALQRQFLLSGSMQSHLGGQYEETPAFFEKACAAAGQSGLQSLYELLFAQYHMACSQILSSDADFRDPAVRSNLRRTIVSLLDVGIIPVINENDVITKRTIPLVQDKRIAWDNDSLASQFAREMEVDLFVILTDIDGIYRLPRESETPDEHGYVKIDQFKAGDVAVTHKRSRVGALGQKDKANSCIRAVDSGSVSRAIVAKMEAGVILQIVRGEEVGTTFVSHPGAPLGDVDDSDDPLYSGINPTSKL